MKATRAYLLIEERMGEPLEAFVRERRRLGDSWNSISVALLRRTDVAVTNQTLINWFADSERAVRT
jgi:hypothetical protein